MQLAWLSQASRYTTQYTRRCPASAPRLLGFRIEARGILRGCMQISVVGR